jgi:plasmid stability protein
MPTLYVENVPKDLYEALRKRARAQRRSIAAEVISLLEENIPTEKELARRREVSDRLRKLKFTPTDPNAEIPSSLEMIREDRDR